MKITGIVVASLCAWASFAVETKVWSQNTQAEFEKGNFKGLSLRSDGQVSLAPSIREVLDPALPVLWAAAHDSKGNLFVAGGGAGGSMLKIFRIDKAGKSTVIGEVEGLAVLAIAVDKQDRVYAATSPQGKIWRIPVNGKPEAFCDPKAKYIWSMAFSSRGDLFVATGDEGEIHKVAPDGKGAVFYRLEEAHARSMAIDAKDNLILGTEPSGLVVRISPAGQGFVLHQTGKREVTSVAVSREGRIVAAAVGNKSATTVPLSLTVAPAPAPVIPQGQAGPTARSAAPPPPPMSLPSPGVTGGSEIVEIDSEGAPRKLWGHAQDIAYALAFDPKGELLAGTGNRGAIYRIDSPTRFTLLTSSTSSQITAFSVNGDGAVMATTGNVGRVIQVGPGVEKQASLESDVFDAGVFARWGRINDTVASNGGSVVFETRSGNLDRPQKSWSPWAALQDGRVASPPARFLQWRATLKAAADGKSPELTGADVAWLAKNTAPRMEEVEATPANYKFPAPSTTTLTSQTLTLPPLGKSARPGSTVSLDSSSSASLTYAKGSAGIRWLAADDNGDTLQFKVELRGVQETTWKLLKERIREKYVSFDSTAFPDGEYLARVTASDAPDNSPDQALTATGTSSSFLIDNTPPSIEQLSAQPAGGRVQLRFRAKDALSWISKAEYSINGVEWMVVEPTTKLSDSRELEYSLLLDRPAPGELTIAVRVSDENDNQSVAKVVVK